MSEGITTWGQAVDYCFRTRHTWRHGNGSKTAAINCGHFTRLRGRSYPLSKITPACIQQVSIELEEEGKSDSTINRVVSAISTVLNHTAFDDLLGFSVPKFRRRKEGEHRITFFTKPQVEGMVEAAVVVFDRQDLADAILFAAFTGVRMSELLAIKAEDIDLGAGVIHVGGREGFITKSQNYRTIPIHDRIRGMLMNKMELVGPNVHIFGDEWNDKDQLLRAFKKVRAYINLDESYVFHTLRHSFATWCIDAGINVRVVMSVLGHKRIETTLRYVKVSLKAVETVLSI